MTSAARVADEVVKAEAAAGMDDAEQANSAAIAVPGLI